jgi:hypothetical protein
MYIYWLKLTRKDIIFMSSYWRIQYSILATPAGGMSIPWLFLNGGSKSEILQ